MARQVKDYINEAEYAAGGSFDGRLNPLQMVNDAGEYLFNLHAWPWRERATADLDLVEDQTYVALPTDFGSLIDVVVNDNGGLGDINLTEHSVIERLRQADPEISPTSYYLALEWPTQTAQTSAPPAPRLAIYPTPSAASTGALQLVYRAKWATVTTVAQYPNIPVQVESLLVEMVRATAIARVENVPLDKAMEPIRQGTMLADLITFYGTIKTQRRSNWVPTVINVYDRAQTRVPQVSDYTIGG